MFFLQISCDDIVFFYRIHHIVQASAKALRQQITNIEAQRLNKELKDALDDLNQNQEKKAELLSGKRLTLAEELSEFIYIFIFFPYFNFFLLFQNVFDKFKINLKNSFQHSTKKNSLIFFNTFLSLFSSFFFSLFFILFLYLLFLYILQILFLS